MSTKFDPHIKIKLEPDTDPPLDSENGIPQSADDIVNQKPEFVNVKMEIDIESNISKEEKHKELKKELKRKRHCERQRAYYQRQKNLKKNEEKKKKKKVPKTNAERQREFRQRKAEKSYVDIVKQEFKQPLSPDSTSRPSSPAPATMLKMEYGDPVDSMNHADYYPNGQPLDDQHQESYSSSYLVPAMMQPNTSQYYYDNGKKPLNKPRTFKNIQEHGMSLRDVQTNYNIHRNTLHNKIKGKHSGSKPGLQTIFSPDEENEFLKHAITVSHYGFPITHYDLRSIVQTYLRKLGRKVPNFKGNWPGLDWVNGFIKRHKSMLSHRLAKNINNASSALDADVVNNFFDHLQKELKDVPAVNIWNYAEINLVDDPRLNKDIERRGCKYPEIIRNSTKACTSIMVSGNAVGDIIPVYVNYKSQKLQQSWTKEGPEGARYNCSKSGWFDTQSFEDWFIHLMLPILMKLDGKKVVIGDNLSSHLNFEVVKACKDYNISFVCLPPKATNLFQPLDVAYFQLMKVSWRKILSEWKQTGHDSECPIIPKDSFPKLLKKFFGELELSNKEHLISGFRKCGISPINKTAILDHLPQLIMETSLQVRAVSELT